MVSENADGGKISYSYDLSGKAVSVTEINTDEISTEYNTYDSDGKLLKSENSDSEEATQRTVSCVRWTVKRQHREPSPVFVVPCVRLYYSVIFVA